jgi:hypothetical protein
MSPVACTTGRATPFSCSPHLKKGGSIVKTWLKVALVTLIVGVAAMALGPILWPIAQGGPQPTTAQLFFFIVLEAIQSLAFGLGVSFLLFGLPTVLRVSPNSRVMAWAMYLSIGWLLVSWWPHGHLHQVVGENLQGLLYIEYGFHVTLIIGAIVLAYGFLSLLREHSKGTTTRVA